MYREVLELQTRGKEQLVDVTDQLKSIASAHPEAAVMCVFAQGATAAVMIQENWDPNIQGDILQCLQELVPPGRWMHDQVDHNGDAHIKAGIVGPSETIPLEDGEMLLGSWQNVFFCDFDGPRRDRRLMVTLLS